MFGCASRRSSAGVLTALALTLAGCVSPTEVPKTQPAQLTLQANVSGTSITTMVVTVSGPGIGAPLVFNPTVSGGTALGNITIPAGSNRLIKVEAYDENHVKTHTGETTISVVNPGSNNPAIIVALVPIPGEQPVNVTFSGYTILVSGTATVLVGGTSQLSVSITGGDGQPVTPVSGDVKWATENPAIAGVSASGLVTGVAVGTVKVMATYKGVGASINIVVN